MSRIDEELKRIQLRREQLALDEDLRRRDDRRRIALQIDRATGRAADVARATGATAVRAGGIVARVMIYAAVSLLTGLLAWSGTVWWLVAHDKENLAGRELGFRVGWYVGGNEGLLWLGFGLGALWGFVQLRDARRKKAK